MTIHPARAVAGLALGAAGFVVGVAALAVLLAKLLVNAGMPAQPADVATLNDVVAVLPFVIGFAGVNLVAAAGMVLGSDWAQRLAVIVSSAGIVIGAFGLFLVVVGHDPFATSASARAYTDGVEILATFTVTYLVVLGLVAVARQPIRRFVRGAA
jgi:hypothetical protein